MSRFSKALSDMMKKHKITAYGLSKSSGVDRTLIQKMLAGTRNPADRDKALSLAEAMQLTAYEREAFLRARDITVMGEDVYEQLLKVHEFVTLFKKLEVVPVVKADMYSETLPPPPEYMEGSLAVNQAIKMVLDRAASGAGNQTIDVFSGTECSFLTNYLTIVLQGSSNVRIRHLIPFESAREGERKCFNLEQMISTLPAILGSGHYEPRYFYVANHEAARLDVLPHYILTRDGVLGFSHDFSCCIFCSSEETSRFFSGHFERICAASAPLLNSLDTPAKNMQYYTNLRADTGAIPITLTYQPCFLSVLDEYYFREYGNPAVMAAVDSGTDIFSNFLKCQQNIHCTADSMYSVFCLDGVREFLDTGRLAEFPDAYYSAFRPEDRKKVVADLVAYAERSGKLNMLLLHNDRLYSKYMYLGSYSERTVTAVHNHPLRGYSAFSITEENVSSAVYGYLTALKDSEYVLCAEKSLAEMKKLLSQY